MKSKSFFFCVLATACVAFTGCEPEDEPTGTTEIEIPGLDEGYNQALLTVYQNGESDVKGLYSTLFNFNITSSDDPDKYMVIGLTAFHKSTSFTPGTYTFPSTGDGTASLFVVDMPDLDGTAVSGKVTIATSGSDYTITIDNASVKLSNDGGTVPVSFVYKGTASNVGGIGTTVTDPEYPGVSTIKDAVSGTTIPYMNMKGDYSRPIEGLHQNRVYLSSEIDGVRWSIYLELYGAARGVDGTYDYWSEGEPAAGLFTGSVSADDANAFFSGGTITVAETGGVYTITLEDISAVRNVSDTEPAAILNGTYTGICSEFYDSTSN